jgi:hypothetical protein
MPKVRLLNGKPLLVGGKVAMNDACCCGEGACPDSIEFTVSGISVNCGCRGGGGSYYMEDLSINGGPFTASVGGDPETGICEYLYFDDPGIRRHNFSDGSCVDPTGTPTQDSPITWRILRYGGIWYAHGEDNFGSLEFHGATSDPSDPISNILGCTQPQNICDDFVFYYISGTGCNDFYPDAQGGTVTLTLP